jgi:hypothetical protein
MHYSAASSNSKYSPLNASFRKFLYAIFLRPSIAFFATPVLGAEINMSKSCFVCHEPRLRISVSLNLRSKTFCALWLCFKKLCVLCAFFVSVVPPDFHNPCALCLLQSKNLCHLKIYKPFALFVFILCDFAWNNLYVE